MEGGGAFATAFGIWATHFIAMLGYDPGFQFGFSIGTSAASLLIVTAAMLVALLLPQRRSSTGLLVAAGLVAMSGIGRYYVGMAAIDMPARIRVPRLCVAVDPAGGSAVRAAMILAVRRSIRSGIGAAR